MVDVSILKFFRYPDGSLEALINYAKTITVATNIGHPPKPEDKSVEDHEAEFFAAIQAHAEADCKSSSVDVSDVEGKTAAELIAEAAAKKAAAAAEAQP